MMTNRDRFRAAVGLLVGPGPLKQRLGDAYLNHLSEVCADELPRDLRAAYAAVASAMQSGRRTGSLSAVAASVLKMSEADAAGHAQAILSIFVALDEPVPGQAAARAAPMLRAVADDQDLPAFLSRA